MSVFPEPDNWQLKAAETAFEQIGGRVERKPISTKQAVIFHPPANSPIEPFVFLLENSSTEKNVQLPSSFTDFFELVLQKENTAPLEDPSQSQEIESIFGKHVRLSTVVSEWQHIGGRVAPKHTSKKSTVLFYAPLHIAVKPFSIDFLEDQYSEDIYLSSEEIDIFLKKRAEVKRLNKEEYQIDKTANRPAGQKNIIEKLNSLDLGKFVKIATSLVGWSLSMMLLTHEESQAKADEGVTGAGIDTLSSPSHGDSSNLTLSKEAPNSLDRIGAKALEPEQTPKFIGKSDHSAKRHRIERSSEKNQNKFDFDQFSDSTEQSDTIDYPAKTADGNAYKNAVPFTAGPSAYHKTGNSYKDVLDGISDQSLGKNRTETATCRESSNTENEDDDSGSSHSSQSSKTEPQNEEVFSITEETVRSPEKNKVETGLSSESSEVSDEDDDKTANPNRTSNIETQEELSLPGSDSTKLSDRSKTLHPLSDSANSPEKIEAQTPDFSKSSGTDSKEINNYTADKISGSLNTKSMARIPEPSQNIAWSKKRKPVSRESQDSISRGYFDVAAAEPYNSLNGKQSKISGSRKSDICIGSLKPDSLHDIKNFFADTGRWNVPTLSKDNALLPNGYDLREPYLTISEMSGSPNSKSDHNPSSDWEWSLQNDVFATRNSFPEIENLQYCLGVSEQSCTGLIEESINCDQIYSLAKGNRLEGYIDM